MSDDQIRVHCPSCGRRFRVDPATVPEGGSGSQARCRGCGAAFAVVKRAGALTVEASDAGAKAAVAPSAEPPAGAPVPRRRRHAKARARDAAESSASTPAKTRPRPPEPALSDTEAALLGHRVGRYEVEQLLGHGGMGNVYKAYDPAANRPVALKVLGSQCTELDAIRFRREIEVQGNIQHPHIMPIFDSGSIGDTRYYTMELLKDPVDLVELTRQAHSGEAARDPKLRPVSTLPGIVEHIVLPVCRAIHHANVKEGVLHRDLKPGNVLLDRSDLRPLVIDFGVSALIEKKNVRLAHLDRTCPVPLSGDGISVTGTLLFMPPEQMRGDADRRGDVWALGALLHYLVTDAPPLETAVRPKVSKQERVEGLRLLIDQARSEGKLEEAQQFEGVLAELERGEERGIEELRRDILRGRYLPRPPGMSRGLDAIITKAMATDPAARYRHALDLHDDLQAWLEGRPVRALVTRQGAAGSIWYRGRLLLRRHRKGVAAVLLLALAAVAFLTFWPKEKSRPPDLAALTHLDDALRHEKEGRWSEARRAAREAMRADPELDEPFLLLRRLDGAEQLRGDIARARELRDIAEDAFRRGNARAGRRCLAALAELLDQGILPALPPQRDPVLQEELAEFARYARGTQALRVTGAPEGAAFLLIPVTSEGALIAWGEAQTIAASSEEGAEPPSVGTGSWILRIRRKNGEVFLPFVAAAGGEGIDLRCPLDPGTLPAGTVYVGAGLGRGAGGPKAVRPLIWDRSEVTAARYARFLDSLEPAERRRRVPRLAGPLGGRGQPLWEATGSRFRAPSGASRRPVEGVSLYDARAFARFEGKRLPTAAEWAWAASGPDLRPCSAGALRHLYDGAAHLDRPLAGVADVESAPRDRSPFGLYDMSGNLAEFTSVLGTLRGTSGWWVVGGSYLTDASEALISSARVVPGYLPLQGVGIRCVRDVE